jgi:EmrB/QacA subfamily drug resistance transporter
MNHPTSRAANKPLVLLSLLLAAFAINLDTTIVNVALPSLVRELHATDTQLQWIVDAYNLVFAAFILAAGSLSDKIGRKGLLLSGLAVFGLSSLAGAAATNANQLIAARAVMGLGAAMVFPATLSLISNVFTERNERARAIGLWGATAGMAIALGPIFGGWLLARYSWASIFVAMAPVALAGIVLVARFVPTSREAHAAPLDRPGIGYSTLAMSLLVFTIIEAPTYGWLAPRSLAGFALAALLLGAFLIREGRTRYPMLDMHLFRNRRFSAACAAVTVAFFTLFGFIFLMTQYFQFVKNYSALSAGVHLLPVAISVGVSSVLGTRLAVRFGSKLVVTTGLVMITAFYLWVALSVTPTLPYGVIAAQMVLYGIGMGLTSAPATESIMGVVPLERAGVGSAVNDATRLLGGTLGVAVIGSVFASTYAARLTSRIPTSVPGPVLGAAKASVGEAFGAARALAASGHAALGGVIHQAAQTAFIHGLSIGCLVAAIVGAAGALTTAALLPAQPLGAADAPPAENRQPAFAPAE